MNIDDHIQNQQTEINRAKVQIHDAFARREALTKQRDQIEKDIETLTAQIEANEAYLGSMVGRLDTLQSIKKEGDESPKAPSPESSPGPTQEQPAEEEPDDSANDADE